MTNKLKLLTGLVAITAMFWTVGKPALAHHSHEHDADSLEQFQADGSGTLVFPDFDPQTATIKGNRIGDEAQISYTIVNDALLTSTARGQCADKRGTATITAEDGSTINMQIAGGLGCSITTATPFEGISGLAYLITGGTGRFAGAGGTGNFTLGESSLFGGTFWVHIDGNIFSEKKDSDR